jgi:hypothetical protein
MGDGAWRAMGYGEVEDGLYDWYSWAWSTALSELACWYVGVQCCWIGVWKRRGEGDDFKVAFRLSYMIFQEPSLIVKSRCRERIGRTNRYMVTENLRL